MRIGHNLSLVACRCPSSRSSCLPTVVVRAACSSDLVRGSRVPTSSVSSDKGSTYIVAYAPLLALPFRSPDVGAIQNMVKPFATACALAVLASLACISNAQLVSRLPDFCHGLDCPKFEVTTATDAYEVREYESGEPATLVWMSRTTHLLMAALRWPSTLPPTHTACLPWRRVCSGVGERGRGGIRVRVGDTPGLQGEAELCVICLQNNAESSVHCPRGRGLKSLPPVPPRRAARRSCSSTLTAATRRASRSR